MYNVIKYYLVPTIRRIIKGWEPKSVLFAHTLELRDKTDQLSYDTLAVHIQEPCNMKILYLNSLRIV